MRIESVEVRVVAPPVERFRWSDDLPEQYQTNTLIRIKTDEGVEGIGSVWNATSHGFECYTAESLRHLIPVLLGRDPLQRDQLNWKLRPRVFPLPPGALALIDIALWDLQGKVSGLPIFELLGGARDKIQAYASTPMLKDVDAYLEFVEELLGQGFRAIKFHTWCIAEEDLKLAREVRKRYPDVDFMLDAENNYDRHNALRVAQELDDLQFRWLEAPLHDSDWPGYRELCAAVCMPVIPSGNWIQDLTSFQETMRTGCWRATRTDVTILGGITPARNAMLLAEEEGMNCELMSWGYSLGSVANLHVMLASHNCSYYEQPLPYAPYEHGMQTVIRTDEDGYVNAPNGPGLGLEVDWPTMLTDTIHVIESKL